MSLPERINGIRVITYIPQEIKDSLAEMNPDTEISDQDVFDVIEEYLTEDFGSTDFILQDQDGEEL